jgi:iron complex transport system ATP-binding protein
MSPSTTDAMTATGPALIECAGLSVSIGGRRVVEALDLSLAPGQSLGVLGPNGAGKTTLLLTLAGVRAPEAGTLRLAGRDLQPLARRDIALRLGMMTQNTRFAFDATVLETALAGRHPHLGALGRESAADFEAARGALAEVGLDGLAERSCRALSGGEQRRLALAVVLAQDPDVLLLDEPTNHLDPAHQVDILDGLWRRLHARRGLQIMALHDINLATCYCTDVLMLDGDGRWALGPTGEMLTEARLSALFGCPIRAVSDGAQTVFAVAARAE